MRTALFVLGFFAISAPVKAQEVPPPVVETCPEGTVAATSQDCASNETPPGPFIVFFPWGSLALDNDADIIVHAAAEAYADGDGAFTILLEGHSDRSGPASVNERISRQRAETVRAALQSRGVPSEAMDISVAGESAVLIGTADGIREAQNRRVEIHFSRSEN